MKNNSGNYSLPPFSNNELCNLQDKVNEIEKRIKFNESLPNNVDLLNANNLITNNANNIENLQTIVTTNTQDIETLQSNVATNTSDIDTLQTSISTNTQDIETLETNVATNANTITTLETAVATNTSDIDTLQTSVTTNTQDIATLQTNVATNVSNITALQNAVETNTENIATNVNAITTLQTTVATNTADIATLETQTNTNANNIDTLQVSVATNTANIATNTSDISTLKTAVATNTTDIATMQAALAGLPSASNLSNIETAVATNTSDIATLQTGMATNTGNITTNTNNITNLTTSVNSCIQAVNDINNNAELPAPLFTIAGHSFGTPVYSVYDEYTYINYYLLKNANYNKRTYFIVEPNSLVHFNIEVVIEVPTKLEVRNLIITINDIIMKKIPYEDTTQGEITLETSLNFVASQKDNYFKIYIDSTTNERHVKSVYKAWGKNILFINRKQKYKISPNIDNNYIFTRTYNHYPQVQIATLENLDFENGWEYINNYQNYRGSNHTYFKTFTYDSATSTYTQGPDYLAMQIIEQYEQRFKFFNLSTNFSIICGGALLINNATILRDYLTNELVFHCGTSGANNQTFCYTFYENRKICYAYNYNFVNYGFERPKYIVDTYNLVCLPNAFNSNFIVCGVYITELGEAYLNTYIDGSLNIICLGFGTQPFACYENTTGRIAIYLNRYGTIVKLVYQLVNRRYNFVEESVFDYGDSVIIGYNNEYFLQINDELLKKVKG